MKRRITYIAVSAIFAAYIVAVLCLTLLDLSDKTPELPKYFLGIPMDKIAHFLMFLPYPVIAYIAFRPSGERKWAHLLVLTAVFAVGIGMAIGTERLQGLADYRSYEIEDFYADVFGMECSSLITALYIIIKKHKT